jgi:ABC-type nitrate/sulfonate/bicarbonate transport system substrate-binding protein
MRNLLRRLTVVAIVAGLLVSCSAAPTPITTGSAAPTAKEVFPSAIKIGVGGGKSYAYLPLYVAQGKGYLQEELGKIGVNAEVVEFANGPLAIQALQSDQVQYVAGGIITILAAASQGAKIGQFFQFFDSDVLVAIAQPNQELTTAALQDKRWGITAVGAANQVAAILLAKSYGVPQDRVKLVVVGPPSSYVPALEGNRVDILLAGEPAADDLLIAGKAKLVADFFDPAVSTKIYGGTFATTGMQSSVAYIKAHPELTRAVSRASLRALQFIQQNRNTPEAIAAALPVEMRTPNIAAIMKRMIPGLSPDGAINNGSFDRAIAASKESGVIEASAQFNIEDVAITGFNK